MIGLFVLAATVGADLRCAARVDFYQPSHGIVSTPRVAVQIAHTYLNAIYGKAQVDLELPLKVSIRREVWHVTGKDLPKWSVGGVAEIDICQSTGQVLRVFHGE